MFPQSVCGFYGCTAIAVRVLDESIVDNDVGLWEAIHALPDFDGDFAIACDGTHVVLGHDLVLDVG